jgi:NAD(P)-dependent dehydrogenase (short-subunit alcohol dehydrogenase family)
MNTSNQTVLITGASSGIGLETALYFFEQGWNVIATMRNPEKRQTELHRKNLPDLVHLDVMDSASIESAIQYSINKYGKIDILVNNAGYAAYGLFEASTPQQLKRQFEVNVFGLMEMTRQILPLFRRQKSGVLINVASMGGRIGFPFYSLYNSTKWAVEGFSEALQYELRPLNIRVKIIEPGVIFTDFYDRSLDIADPTAWTEAYGETARLAAKPAEQRNGSPPRTVARRIFQAATDNTWRLRYRAGSDATLVAFLRWLLPEGLFYKLLGRVFIK